MPSPPPLLSQARAAHARGDVAGALKAYDTILKLDPRNFEAAYFRAVALYQAGQLERAADGFAAAARLNPRRVEPHKDRGLVLMKLGRHAEARDSFAAATRLSPSAPELLLNLGIAQKNSGEAAQSVASYEAALRLKPGFAEAHNNLGNSLALLGRKPEALEHYAMAAALKPGYGEAHVNAAALLLELGRGAEARQALETAVTASPRHAEAHRLLARCQEDDGDTEAALASCDRALALDPRHADTLLAKARLLGARGRHAEAIALCDAAIAVDPADARPYYRIGRSLEAEKEHAAALASYTRAGELDPGWFLPLYRRASLLAELNRFEAAIEAYGSAIAANPEKPEAHLGRGACYRSLRRFAEALACYDRAIALDASQAQHFSARGWLLGQLGRTDDALADIGHGLNMIASEDAAARAMAAACTALLSVDKIPAVYRSEDELAATRERVEEVLDSFLATVDPHAPRNAAEVEIAATAARHLTGFYLAYHQRNDRETMRKLSKAAACLLQPDPCRPPERRSRPSRIRLGIASQRLRDHNGANWAYNWLRQLPRDDYEVFTYSFEVSHDAMARKFAALGTHRELSWSGGSALPALEQMRGDDLDVLMLPDVGMTAVSRFLSLHRIAPCQFTAWGHPVTTGSPEIDHYLSSDLMEPPDGQEHYTEALVRMPNLALYLEEEAPPPPASAGDFGLPQSRLLYGCLQSLFKYLPRYDTILPLVAREVPEALFVFLEGNQPYMTAILRERLDKAFAAEGLEAARHVAFLPRQSAADFDRLMGSMDVLVDSVGWSGGNTSLTAIAQGVPLATLPGAFMRGRHTSAMFTRIGAEEMIATSLEDYVAKLVALGRDGNLRRHCAELFAAGRHRLYRDQDFAAAFDAFLKKATVLP